MKSVSGWENGEQCGPDPGSDGAGMRTVGT